jgi:hypothetical protein
LTEDEVLSLKIAKLDLVWQAPNVDDVRTNRFRRIFEADLQDTSRGLRLHHMTSLQPILEINLAGETRVRLHGPIVDALFKTLCLKFYPDLPIPPIEMETPEALRAGIERSVRFISETLALLKN